jgi:hypothetical protein
MACATEVRRIPLAIGCSIEGNWRDLPTGRASFLPLSLAKLPLETGYLTGARTPGLQRGRTELT